MTIEIKPFEMCIDAFVCVCDGILKLQFRVGLRRPNAILLIDPSILLERIACGPNQYIR
jgi:hypothetical protein